MRAAKEFGPDAVVLDMMLPDFDGLEVLRRMRGDDPNVPVLFLTAKDAVEDRVAWSFRHSPVAIVSAVVLAVQDAKHEVVGHDAEGGVGHHRHRRHDGKHGGRQRAVAVGGDRVVGGERVGHGAVALDGKLDGVGPHVQAFRVELGVVGHLSPIGVLA